MRWTYFLIDICSILGPILLSFEKRVHFFSSWKSAFIAALIVAIPFLIWDAIFTNLEFWGFNSKYLLGVFIYKLPLEELIFFIAIPFACTFTYEVVRYYFRSIDFNYFSRFFFFLVPIYSICLLFTGDIAYYTLAVVISSSIVLIWVLLSKFNNFIAPAFVITLIPFLIVNGILTGYLTTEPIVWYSESQITGLRIRTIPAEDFLYSFTMFASNILIYEKLQKKYSA